MVQWDQPKEPNGQVMGYKILYTKSPTLPETAWHEYQVDSNQLTTLSNLTPLATYTIRVTHRTSSIYPTILHLPTNHQNSRINSS